MMERLEKPSSTMEDARLAVMGKLGMIPEGTTVSALVRDIREAESPGQLRTAEALHARVRKLEDLSGWRWHFDQKFAEWEEYYSALAEYTSECIATDDIEVARELRTQFAYA